MQQSQPNPGNLPLQMPPTTFIPPGNFPPHPPFPMHGMPMPPPTNFPPGPFPPPGPFNANLSGMFQMPPNSGMPFGWLEKSTLTSSTFNWWDYASENKVDSKIAQLGYQLASYLIKI